MAKAGKKPRGEQAPPTLPPTVKMQIVAGGREWHFRRRLAHALALPALLLALGFGLHALQLARLPGPPPRPALLQAHALSCLLLAAALHLGTLRWRVRVDAAGLGIDRSSWLWPRMHRLPLSALVGLKHRLSYTMTTTSGSKESTVHYHAVFAPLRAGRELKVSPGLPGPASASAMVRHLTQAGQGPLDAAPADARPARSGHLQRWAWAGWLAVVLLGWLFLLLI